MKDSKIASLLADARGAPTGRLFIPQTAVGANKIMFDLFNGMTNVFMVVKQVTAIPERSVAATGLVSVKLFLQKTSAIGTGGTAATLNAANTAPSFTFPHIMPLPTGLSARAAPGGGATAAGVVAERQVIPEETSAAPPHTDFMRPEDGWLLIPPGAGMSVVQSAVASVGLVGFDVAFADVAAP